MISNNKENNDNERDCPDGGWGWAVLVAALIIRMILSGLVVSFGLFITPLVVEYKTSQSTISWIASLLSASALAAAPLATFMSIKLSDRAIVMIGSAISCVAFTAPFFYSPLWFMFMSSILTGVGIAIAMMNTTIILTKYFDQKLSIVNGIFTSGTGIASFVITPIFDKLITLYGFRLSMLIYGCMFFFCGLCAIVFKELPKKTKVVDNDNAKMENHVEKNTVVINIDGHKEPTKPTNIHNFLSATNIANNYNSDIEITDKRLFTSLQHIQNQEDNFERKIVGNLLTNMSVSTLLGMSIGNNLNEKKENEIKNNAGNEKQKPLWKNYVFILFVISNFLTNLGHDTIFMYAKQRAVDMKVTESKAAFLLIAVGIGSTIGRLLFGYLGSRKEIKTYVLYFVSLIMVGGFLIFSRFALSYPLMLVYTSGFGLFIGSYVTLTSVVLLDIVGLQNFTKGLGLTFFVQSIGLLICSPMSGAIYDATKTFHWSFINSGVLILSSGLMLLLGYTSKSFRESQKN
uniref:Slc16a-9 n=1 Tax=Schmidtea mediterranea TaxID=79327 RepID=A0A0H3YJ47_SCHMD|nr:slc16a-9 [Schmidtea mediterranea]